MLSLGAGRGNWGQVEWKMQTVSSVQSVGTQLTKLSINSCAGLC